jgi:hypothetical protein
MHFDDLGVLDGGDSGSRQRGTLESSSVFEMPVSQVATPVIGRSGVSNRSKVGLLMVVDPETFCRGAVSGDGPKRWCTKHREGCGIRAHEGEKVEPHAFTYYIKCQKGSYAQVEPYLDARSSSIPTEDSEQGLEGQLETIATWATYFRTIMGHAISRVHERVRGRNLAVTRLEEGSTDLLWENVDVPGIERFREDVVTMKTPG